MFKQLRGIPDVLPMEQVVPFSMSALLWRTNNPSFDLPDVDPLDVFTLSDAGFPGYEYRLNGDRTFNFRPVQDKVSPGYKIFEWFGYNDEFVILDVNHHDEKIFGYDRVKGQFFHVKMHQLEHDVRFVVHDRSYYLSKIVE